MRKKFFRAALALVAVVVVAMGGLTTWAFLAYRDAKVDTVGKVDFDRLLAIPELAPSTVEADGTRVFDLDMQRGETDLGKSEPTRTWGINGTFLGPTLRAERGEKVRVEATNDVGEPTSLHWHGMHLPAEMDGGPHQMIEPGETWEPHWTIDQPAATLWYHPHLHGKTASHVYKGLAGMFILDDPEESALALPKRYGVDDLPLIVQDKRFDSSGQLDEGHSIFSNLGTMGDEILVNGTPSPYVDVTTEAVRLRLLNGSGGRAFNFTFDDGRTFEVVATDGGLLDSPVRLDRLQLAPGERAEIVVRFTPGEDVVLRSEKLSDGGGRFAGSDSRFDVLQLRAARSLAPSPATPAHLTTVERLDPDDATTIRDFDMEGVSINGRTMDMSRIDFAATLDTTEIWRVTNTDGSHHSFHVHDVQFQVLDIDGEEPSSVLSGWKDTIWLPPNEPVRLIMRFSDYADPDSPYMFHCHMLRHEDEGMMGQFVVVEPGESMGEMSMDDMDHMAGMSDESSSEAHHH